MHHSRASQMQSGLEIRPNSAFIPNHFDALWVAWNVSDDDEPPRCTHSHQGLQFEISARPKGAGRAAGKHENPDEPLLQVYCVDLEAYEVDYNDIPDTFRPDRFKMRQLLNKYEHCERRRLERLSMESMPSKRTRLPTVILLHTGNLPENAFSSSWLHHLNLDFKRRAGSGVLTYVHLLNIFNISLALEVITASFEDWFSARQRAIRFLTTST